MEFYEFKTIMSKHISLILKQEKTLFTTGTNKDELWNLYLDSFPAGTNKIYRERREFDCNCCKQFIRQFGNVVVVKNNQLVSIWDFKTNDTTFQPVIDTLSNYVKSFPIKDVFITKEQHIGTDQSHEMLATGDVHTWEHFYFKLPKKFVTRSTKSIGDLKGKLRDVKHVLQRSIEEISQDAVETVLELIAQKSLYKGDEWKYILKEFLTLHKRYWQLPKSKKDNFCWKKSVETSFVVGKIRNHSIGVLLTDITEGMDLNQAVTRYEKIVAPENYKRPKAIYTKAMLKQAQKQVEEMGLLDSLGRRYAVLDDITINNILYANKDTAKKMAGNVFEEMEQEVSVNPKKFDKVKEVFVEDFVEKILPTCTGIEVLLENKHTTNLVSLIAPKDKDAKSLFKWNNNFSWAYNGNITDSSMKERVKSAGGKVDGVLRFSIQWNENGDNINDFDAHCTEPNKNHIYYSNKGITHRSTGMLDVDILEPKGKVAVENITWANLDQMYEGKYQFYVHNYCHRGGRSGFSAEIEFGGEIFSFEYDKELKQNEKVLVAEIDFNRKTGIKFLKSLNSTVSAKEVWNLQTNRFHPVSVIMNSPNYWDEQQGIGHKHLFFILKDCKNEEQPNGFFNEFLHQDLMEHKRVFEALGSKMRVVKSDEQLSGLGFSSTRQNELICKIEGKFNRMIKIVF